jgi:hypothetical protein
VWQARWDLPDLQGVRLRLAGADEKGEWSMTDDDDYGVQPQTVALLEIFREGADMLQRERDPEGVLKRSADVLHEMTDEEKGITIIDLLVLFCELEHLVLAERSKKLMGEVSGE